MRILQLCVMTVVALLRHLVQASSISLLQSGRGDNRATGPALSALLEPVEGATHGQVTDESVSDGQKT